MEADGSHLYANWLNPIIDLIRDRDFGEAYALDEYFPATPGRKLVQCVALLCQDKLSDADSLLKTLSAKIRQLSPDFVRIHSEVDLDTDLLEASRAAIKNKCLALSLLCLESHLRTHPESVQTVIDGLIAIVSQALITNNLDVGLACLDRVTELDDSPARLIQYAEIALANLQKSSAQALSKFVRDLINQALNRLPQEDVDNQLKIAKLLATIDVESFRTACKLLRQILHAHPSAGPEVAVLLLPLIDYLPYFSDIADFLLDVDPGNVAPLTEQLVKTYERSRNQSYLKKAQFLLNALDYVRLGYSSQLVTSLLIVGRKSNNFELYAQRLVGLELELDIALNVARILIRNRRTSDYDLVMWFLEQALQRGPAARTSVFPLYIRLSEVAASHNHLEQREEFLRRAVNLAMDLREFLELGGGNTPKQRLSTLFENIDVLSEALWFDQGKEADAFEPIIKEADQYERRQIFYTLLDKPFQIPLIRLKSLFRILFRTGLELTEYDVERIQSVMASLPYELQDVIQERLSQQTIREMDRLSSPGEGRQERQREIVIENDRVIIKGSLVVGKALDGAGEKSLEILDVGGLAEMEKANQAEQSQHSTVNIERHTRIEFPTECVLERKVELRIQLTKDVPKLTRALRLVTFAVSEGTKQVTLDVHITAPGFAVQQWHKPLVLPINGNSEEIFFTLVPLEKGMQVIEIEFFHGSSRVGYVLVKTEVRDWRRPSTKAASNLMSMEDPVDGLKSVAATNTRPVKRTLHVSWVERAGKLYYTSYSEDPNEFG